MNIIQAAQAVEHGLRIRRGDGSWSSSMPAIISMVDLLANNWEIEDYPFIHIEWSDLNKAFHEAWRDVYDATPSSEFIKVKEILPHLAKRLGLKPIGAENAKNPYPRSDDDKIADRLYRAHAAARRAD